MLQPSAAPDDAIAPAIECGFAAKILRLRRSAWSSSRRIGPINLRRGTRKIVSRVPALNRHITTHGRGGGVPRGLGVGVDLGVAVGVGVGVGVGEADVPITPMEKSQVPLPKRLTVVVK